MAPLHRKKAALREEKTCTDKNTRSGKVQISSFVYDIIVYCGIWIELGPIKKSVYSSLAALRLISPDYIIKLFFTKLT